MDLNHFLKPEHRNLEWRKGIPRSWFINNWNEVQRSLQLYITYEWNYTTIYLHQMMFLCHIAGYKTMNLPYFLLMSLTKMSAKIRANPGLPAHFVYHRGLIKILVQYKLTQENQTQDDFLFWEGFKVDSPQTSKNTSTVIRNPPITK